MRGVPIRTPASRSGGFAFPAVAPGDWHTVGIGLTTRRSAHARGEGELAETAASGTRAGVFPAQAD